MTKKYEYEVKVAVNKAVSLQNQVKLLEMLDLLEGNSFNGMAFQLNIPDLATHDDKAAIERANSWLAHISHESSLSKGSGYSPADFLYNIVRETLALRHYSHRHGVAA